MSRIQSHTRREVLKGVGGGTAVALAGFPGAVQADIVGDVNVQPDTLRFLGFGGNTQESQMEVFNGWAEETGTEVTGTSAGGTTEMISLLQQNPGSFDVVAFNDTGMARGQGEGVLTPIDLSKVPNYEENIKESARSLSFNVDGENVVGLIRENGATGFAYNSEQTDGELTSWSDLKDPQYEGRVTLIDRTIDRLSNCAVAIGVDINTVPGDEEKENQVFTEAEEQGQNVFSYWSDGATSIRFLRQENAWIAEAWGGRVLALQEEGFDHIRYVIPEEGAMGWADNLAIVEGTENEEAVHDLLNYTYQRENLLTLSELMNYTVQVNDPPEEMQQLPDYAPAEDLTFRDWSQLLPVQEEWAQRLEQIKQG